MTTLLRFAAFFRSLFSTATAALKGGATVKEFFERNAGLAVSILRLE
jgi:hypothetical protein